jgi:hypothetical protein
MTMLPLGNTALLVSVGAGDLVSNAKLTEIGIEMLIFPTPIRLHGDNLLIKPTLNKRLEFKENLKTSYF